MPVYISPETPQINTGAYFSAKKVGVGIYGSGQNFGASDFCTCKTQCIPSLTVFTDTIGSDFYKNDRHRVYMNTIPSGSTKLYITTPDGVEEEVTGSEYGEEVVLDGFYTYYISFFKCYLQAEFGEYSFRMENLTSSGVVIEEKFSPKFNLKKYSDKAAHGTVRIETRQKGKLQHGTDFKFSSIGQSYQQQIRLNGKFYFSGSTIENSDVQLDTVNRPTLQIKDQIFPEYTLDIYLVSAPQISRVMFDYLFSNSVNISDYNLFNHPIDPRNIDAELMRSIPVKRSSVEFEPSANEIRKNYSIKMEYDYKNVIKTND